MSLHRVSIWLIYITFFSRICHFPTVIFFFLIPSQVLSVTMVLGFQNCCLPSCSILMKRTSSAGFMDRPNKADCWLCPFQRSLKIISVISTCFLKSPFPLCHLHNPLPSLRETLGSGQQRLLYVEEGYMLCSHLHHLTLTAVGATHFWIFGLTLGLVFLPGHPIVATVAELWHAPPC